MRTRMRIGLYGGSFDPIHLGHLMVAEAAREEAGLDRVVFIPAAQSPFKPEARPVAGDQRARLLRLALAGCPWCEVDTRELERGGLSYTVDTVREYRARYPEADFSYLIGADHLRQLPRWRESALLAEWLEFLVIPRPGEPVELPGAPFRMRLLQGFPLAVSSSQIRQRLQSGQPVDLLVGPTVAEAIKNSGLYL